MTQVQSFPSSANRIQHIDLIFATTLYNLWSNSFPVSIRPPSNLSYHCWRKTTIWLR